MTMHDKEPSTLAAAANQAQQAIDSAKEYVASTDFDALRSKTSDAASALYKEGREMLTNSDERARVSDQIAGSIRKNPVAAVGIAFTAGIVLALLVRG